MEAYQPLPLKQSKFNHMNVVKTSNNCNFFNTKIWSQLNQTTTTVV